MKYNELIAEFMGVEEAYNPNGNDWVLKTTTPDTYGDTDILESCKCNELQYHSSWDWLMPVVEKIESDERYDVNILQYGTCIFDNQREIVNNIANISFDKKIDHTYDAVVHFIKDYNKKKVDHLYLVVSSIMTRYGSLDNLICQLREDTDVAYVNIADDTNMVVNEHEVEDIINQLIR